MQLFYLIVPIGGWEIVLILFVVLLLFGGRKIPELMRGLGKGIREFNSARATIESEIKEGMKEVDKKKIEENESSTSSSSSSTSSSASNS
jgi:sec-independent protein translocase protein TatA